MKKFMGRSATVTPRRPGADEHGVRIRMTRNGPELDIEAMAHDRGVEPRQLARDLAAEGEHICTFPKGIVGSIEGDDNVLHVNRQDGETMATFHGWHEAREQDDGSTTVHHLGQKPSAMEKRQPELAQDTRRSRISPITVEDIQKMNEAFWAKRAGREEAPLAGKPCGLGATVADIQKANEEYWEKRRQVL